MVGRLCAEYLSVLEVATKEDLRDRVVRFARGLGFQTVTAIVVLDRPAAEPKFHWVDNAPAAYRELGSDTSRNKRDPVMQHCKRHSVPILWDQATYVEAGQGTKWEEQARFGYRYGISLAMHRPRGRHFLIGVDRDKPLPRNATGCTRMTARLALFAIYAEDAAMRILVSAGDTEPSPSLTSRELETLRWTMEGKTAWEIGRILGIAENTVIRHAHSASRKLGCTSKHHAVVKALRLGLLR